MYHEAQKLNNPMLRLVFGALPRCCPYEERRQLVETPNCSLGRCCKVGSFSNGLL